MEGGRRELRRKLKCSKILVLCLKEINFRLHRKM